MQLARGISKAAAFRHGTKHLQQSRFHRERYFRFRVPASRCHTRFAGVGGLWSAPAERQRRRRFGSVVSLAPVSQRAQDPKRGRHFALPPHSKGFARLDAEDLERGAFRRFRQGLSSYFAMLVKLLQPRWPGDRLQAAAKPLFFDRAPAVSFNRRVLNALPLSAIPMELRSVQLRTENNSTILMNHFWHMVSRVLFRNSGAFRSRRT